MSSSQNQSVSSPRWISFCSRLWRLQGYIWGTVIIGLIINLVSTFLVAKRVDLTGAPLGWLITHPIFLSIGLLLILGQSALAFWGYKRGTATVHTSFSSSAQLKKRDCDIIQAIGKAEQAQPGPKLPTIATLLHFLQNCYPQQDIIDTLKYFNEIGDIQLLQSFGDPLDWSFRLTPYGKRKLALLTLT